MLKRDIKVLKYVKKNDQVSKSKLLEEFEHLKKFHEFQVILPLLDERNLNAGEHETTKSEYDEKRFVHKIPIEQLGDEPEMSNDESRILYSIGRNGQEILEKRIEKLWGFWLPYGITTAIAIASLIAQFLGC